MLRYIGVGLSKTGTSSLCEAFNILGFNSRHYLDVSSYRHMVTRVPGYDYEFVNDLPICSPTRYKQLSGLTPNIKAILTIRDVDDWIKSCRSHWNRYTDSNSKVWEHWRLEVYGISHFDEDTFRKVYDQHITEVKQYFTPDNLLIVDITAGDGWEKLCPFLGVDVPNVDFPFINKTAG